MTDDRDSRRIDGLLASYGEIMARVAALDERAAGAEREREEMRAQHSRDLGRIEKLIGDTRDEFRAGLAAIRQQREEDRAQAAREAQRVLERSQWTRGQWLAAASPTITIIIAALAILTQGHP